MTSLVINVPGEYVSLGLVLQDALEQASKGKGKKRHASEGEAYENQIICEVTRRLGPGYPLGQAVKKIYESQRISGEKGRAELLGAINYIAAAVIVDREMDEHDRALFAKECARAEVENPRFKPGDRVQVRMPTANGDRWDDAVCVSVLPEGTGIRVDYREHKGIAFGWPFVRHAPKAEGVEEPKFKAGDKVQARSIWTGKWEDAVCLHPIDGGFAVKTKDCEKKGFFFHDLRPAPKAEGVEELVRDDDVADECKGCFLSLEKDAPQAKEELFHRIVDCNPATFKPRTPTGEELAEMAEENPHG